MVLAPPTHVHSFEYGDGAVTLMLALWLRALFIVLVATTWNVPVALGAVYTPALVIVPPEVPS